MMTFFTPISLSPPSYISPVVPIPMMVLSLATLISVPLGEMVIFPETLITYFPVAAAYIAKSACVDTVTTVPPAPPVVPPFKEANPSAAALQELVLVADDVVALVVVVVLAVALVVVVVAVVAKHCEYQSLL